MFPSLTRFTFRSLQTLRTYEASRVIEAKSYVRHSHATRENPAASTAGNDVKVDPKKNRSFKSRKTISPNTNRTLQLPSLINLNQEVLPYEILKEDDRRISSLLTACKSRKLRDKNKTILLEGRRLIEDALKANLQPRDVLFSRLDDVKSLPLSPGVRLYKVPYRAIQLWSDLTQPAGLIGIFEAPDLRTTQPAKDAIPLTVICDNVRDPSNLGSIMRVAAGVGCEKLITVKGCADPWNTKVLRCAAGAHFRVPLYPDSPWEEVESLINQDAGVFVTDSRSVWHGRTCEAEKDAEEEEVDVDVDEDEDGEETDHLGEKDSLRISNRRLANEAKRQHISRLPVVPYYDLDYTKNEMILIVPGETGDLSSFSCNLLRNRQGVRINIALSNDVDSLNTGVAFGIVVFEMKRQFIRKLNELK